MREQLYFVAILPPEELAWEIDDIRRDFSMRYGAFKALKPPVHITLKEPFKTPGTSEPYIRKYLHKASEILKDAPVNLKDFGRFTEKVIYIDVVKSPELDALKKEINRAFRQLSPMIEYTKPMTFNPHITIGYRDIPPDRFDIAWEEYALKTFRRSFPLQHFSLLRHDGKQWNTIETFHTKQNNILTLF
ncbi:MAG: 2'-5' RNA ligase family protein [Mucilaginibacter polytrichastri]|nr:2'-5' RNA ligase family protein [Mucilaginibacter polytrichastri]